MIPAMALSAGVLFGRPIRSSLCHENSVCRLSSVRLSVTLVDHIQTAGWIEMPFGVGTCGDPRHIVLDGGPDPHGEGAGGFRASLIGCEK